MADEDLLPLRKSDLQVGIALPYPVYDRQHNLLIAAGEVIHNGKQVETLLKIGLYTNPAWSRTRARSGPVGGARVHTGEPDDEEKTGSAALAPDGGGRAAAGGKTLSSTRLLPGAIVYLQSAGDALKPKSAVKLIGWLEKTAVIVSALSPQGTVLPFRDDEVLQVKTIAGKDIISFFAPVLKMSYVPYPHLHLRWPEQLQVHQLRKSLRVNTRLIVSVSNLTQPGIAVRSARLVNLSAGGAMLETQELLGLKGDELSIGLRLTAAGEAHTLSLNALIRNHHDAEVGPDAQGWGVEFTALPMAERLILEHYIYQMLLEN
ncbi:flagellar brake protein [Chitinilyticum litopenaei]|uniref:flagellar brake protein n=1 Tax=Chitinilyticum litopenaei TaxID=1121276 RepID=UPI0004290E14|nr:flagellar brake protein [Chitinilyticum litopenaei]